MRIYGAEVVGALARGPMTLSEIALETGISVRGVQQKVYVLLKAPRRIYVTDWEYSEVQGKFVPLYAAGGGFSISLKEYKERNGISTPSSISKVLSALKVKHMTAEQLADKLQTKLSTIKGALYRLRATSKQVRIAKYVSSEDGMHWVAAYAIGTVDAALPHSTPLKRQTEQAVFSTKNIANLLGAR